MKNVILLLLGLVIASCSKEDAVIDSNTDVNFNAHKTDDNSLGNYEGTYVATGSSTRGIVAIEITETSARASLKLFEGQEIKFNATQEAFNPLNSQRISFSSEVGSFVFSVNADGSLPQITEVDVNGVVGNIIVAKSSLIGATRAVTGTYGCDDCGGHPIFGNPDLQGSFVWNMLFSYNRNGDQAIVAQISLDDRTFIIGNVESTSSVVDGNMTYTDMGGLFRFGETGQMTWQAMHTADATMNCEGIEGSWNFDSSAYNFSGWIASDAACSTDDDDDLPYCDSNENKVYICHNGNTICVSVNAMEAHLAHGDQLGTCDDDDD